METKLLVLTIALAGGASCVLALMRRGREALQAAGACAALLALLANVSGSLPGAVSCLVVAASAGIGATVAGPWARSAPLGPLVTLLSMGVYLNVACFERYAPPLLLFLGVSLALGDWLAGDLLVRESRVDAAIVGLGVLALGMQSSHTGFIRVLDWSLNASVIALPLLAPMAADAVLAGAPRRRESAIVLGASAAAMLLMDSYAELCLLLAAVGAAYVFGARRRGIALVTVLACAAGVAILGISHLPLRFQDWLEAPQDIYGSGFDLNMFLKSLGRMMPLGVDASDTRILASSDFPRLYALGQSALTFGWAGLILPLACVASIAVAGLRALPALAPRERTLVISLGGLFAGCAIANLAYIFHVLPIPGLSFPLLYLSPTLVVGFLPTGLALCLAAGGRWAGEQVAPAREPDVRALPEGRA